MIFDEPTLPVSAEYWQPGMQKTPPHEPEGGAHGTEPETGLVAPEGHGPYRAGVAADADPYDVPGGSHGTLPEPERDLPQIPEQDVVIYQDPDDPEQAIVVTDREPARGVLGLDPYTLDTEGDDFLIVPTD